MTNPLGAAGIQAGLGTQNVVEQAQQDAANTGATSEVDFNNVLSSLTDSFKTAQIRNLRVNKLMVEEGTVLKAAGKEPNPK